MKDLKISFVLDYKQKTHFHMDYAHPLSTPMIVHSLDVRNDPFLPLEEDGNIFGLEIPYLNAANSTRPDMILAVKILVVLGDIGTRLSILFVIFVEQ
ncbi:hypothetical protein Sango_0782900 [Sesamum angolense]|uniref:Uncharacterized protein n=1 Tax=Sesamum angolense TaxID=2727404 RepID=A0AAE1X3B4_9LAMI|nr:hypothetical protein Sango_0782900 [Sesamum angolense]